MALKPKSKSEPGLRQATQRLALLRPYLDGDAPLTVVAAEAGVALRTARRWLARLREGGPAALARKPRSDAGTRRPGRTHRGPGAHQAPPVGRRGAPARRQDRRREGLEGSRLRQRPRHHQ